MRRMLPENQSANKDTFLYASIISVRSSSSICRQLAELMSILFHFINIPNERTAFEMDEEIKIENIIRMHKNTHTHALVRCYFNEQPCFRFGMVFIFPLLSLLFISFWIKAENEFRFVCIVCVGVSLEVIAQYGRKLVICFCTYPLPILNSKR